MASKRRYDPNDPRDAEQLLRIVEELNDDDVLAQEIDKCDEIQLTLHYPNDGNDSDRDDAGSDEEDQLSYKFESIGRGILSEEMDIETVTRNSKETEKREIYPTAGEEPAPNKRKRNAKVISEDIENNPNTPNVSNIKKSKKILRKWEEKVLEKGNAKNLFMHDNNLPAIINEWKEQNLKPIHIFKLFFDEQFMEHVCKETVRYASQKGVSFTLSVQELYKYFGILILSGYHPLPCRRMYWESRNDTHSHLVSNSFSRNRFEQIHRFLHFNDNTLHVRSNKVYKIQPIIDHVNERFQYYIQPLKGHFSVDEAMEPYYGHHSMKQFIRGKPIRYGYKFWCVATYNGYLTKFSPYTGSGDKEQGNSLGSSVTEKMCIGFLPVNSTIYIDNYFTSLPLLTRLKSEQINCIGTIRKDRVEHAPLSDLKKEVRGAYHALHDEQSELTLIRWHDNNQVTMASNISHPEIFTEGSCNRWSRKDRKKISVPQPNIVQLYNKAMGGVDLFDKLRGLYRIRSKKWYWPIFRFCLNGAMVNMWLLYRNVEAVSLLEFYRRVVEALLVAPDFPTPRGIRPKTPKHVAEEIRLDNVGHLVDKIEKQRRCGRCGKCTKYRCIKCNVGLHPENCFVRYHVA